MTTTKNRSYQAELNSANPNTLADVLRAMLAGLCLSPIKVEISLAAGSTAPVITSTSVFGKILSSKGLDLNGGGAGGIPLTKLPAIGSVNTLRVVSGSASAGPRYVTDAGGSASTTVALLSDDGTTLTFENTVIDFVLEYYPAPAVTMTDTFADFD